MGNYMIAQAVRASVGEAFVVPTRSMSPTIRPGDRILVDKFRRSSKQLHRNDIVVFRSNGPDSPLWVMRVVGLPGDRIEIENEHVFVNGAAWDDRSAVFDGALPQQFDIANYGPETVASDCFFVLGDNRRLSKDSRIIGPIPLTDFYGKARVIYWSQERQFPDPRDTSTYTLGKINWSRIGTRLD